MSILNINKYINKQYLLLERGEERKEGERERELDKCVGENFYVCSSYQLW